MKLKPKHRSIGTNCADSLRRSSASTAQNQTAKTAQTVLERMLAKYEHVNRIKTLANFESSEASLVIIG